MDDQWIVTYHDYDPKNEGRRESLFTLGNGYIATRGAAEEFIANEYHYPGTYLAGGYNRLKSDIGSKVIEHEDLVNWPNWLLLKWKPIDGDWFDYSSYKIVEYKQTLNMNRGILHKRILVADNQGRITQIKSHRLVHMRQSHLAAIQWQLQPLNWSGTIIIHSALDGTVINNGVEKYRMLNGNHLHKHKTDFFDDDSMLLQVETSQSEIRMCQAAKTAVYSSQSKTSVNRINIEFEKYVAQELTFEVEEKKEVIIEKLVSFYTSRDHALSDTISGAKKAIHMAQPFAELCEEHVEVWRQIWDRSDTLINNGGNQEQKLLRLHIFHLFQTLSFNTIDLDVGVPSRGWSGEAYWGQVFWDELFIFPFMNLSLPELTRSLLLYRSRRLPEARYNAAIYGCKGALYPWQSGSSGREETLGFHFNPLTGNWVNNNFQIQHHVNSAVCYNVWQYFQATYDFEFLSFYGAEIMVDIASYWASKATWDQEKGKYVINGVIGPDEYHTKYPDSDKPGINNNAYTNIMAIWVLKHAREVLELLDQRRKRELTERLNITHKELQLWDDVCRNMYIPFSANNKIIMQFEGYDDLKELPWDQYRQNYDNIMRLDAILEKEGDDVNRYKAAKQADVLMLFYLFSAEELNELIDTTGYTFDPKNIPANIEYYHKRTSDGSTLSKVVHSWVLAREHRKISWSNFQTALVSDFEDIQGGTTREGIHLGAMAGTIDLIQRCYTGLELRENALWFNPQLPEDLLHIEFPIFYHGHWIRLQLTHNELKLTCDSGWSSDPVKIMIKNQQHQLEPCGEKTIPY